MDGFMDKLAQKFGSQDVIRANSEAEARELEAAKETVKEYENILSEVRRPNLKGVETNETTAQLVQASIEKLDAYRADGAGKDYTEDIQKISDSVSQSAESTSSLLKEQEEFIHKENVRVYRNVQAAVVEELKAQTETLAAQNAELKKKVKGIKPIAIIALVFSGLTFLATALLTAVNVFGVKLF